MVFHTSLGAVSTGADDRSTDITRQCGSDVNSEPGGLMGSSLALCISASLGGGWTNAEHSRRSIPALMPAIPLRHRVRKKTTVPANPSNCREPLVTSRGTNKKNRFSYSDYTYACQLHVVPHYLSERDVMVLNIPHYLSYNDVVVSVASCLL